MNWYAGMRSELLAEEFLKKLKPSPLLRAPAETPFDFLATFRKPGGMTRTVAVEVMATENAVESPLKVNMSVAKATQMRHSNIPVLLLVVDVKRSRVFHTWADIIQEAGTSRKGTRRSFYIPLRTDTPDHLGELKREIFELTDAKVG
jgi:hypothetical protein